VLWIDEIEKGLASGGGDDGGVSRRVLGYLLTWMEERKVEGIHCRHRQCGERIACGIVAQGPLRRNFLRRSSQRPEVRAAIFGMHLKKRKIAADAFDLERARCRQRRLLRRRNRASGR
jgi:SpoVK/Ycf46/Vps4 family AAA+-type ATPase